MIPVVDETTSWGDGMLGAPWFAGRVWTFDYAHGRLLADEPPLKPGPNTIPLRFVDGLNYATVEATIGGVTYPFLFDTGATRVAEDGTESGTCFVIASLFDAWHAHGWAVVENADANAGGQPSIVVPDVTIAAQTVGPVEFVRRPDKNFHQWMARWTAGPTDGALGGSLFQYFTVTADHVDGLIHFERT
jgi:hypothetical protein